MLEVDDMEFVIYLTFRCNNNCDMCFQNEDFKKAKIKELSAEEWNIFFDSITKKIKHPKVIFMGGEPLLHKDFDKIVYNSFKRGIYTNVITNGFLLENHLDIIKKTETGITISLHGLEKTHNKIVNNNKSFQKIKSVLEQITEIKKIPRFKKKLFCRTNTVILPENADEILSLFEFLEQYSLSDIMVAHPKFASLKKEQESYKICEKIHCGADQHLQLSLKKQYDFENKDFVQKVHKIYDWLHTEYKGKKIFELPALSQEEIDLYYDDEKSENIRKNMICPTPWNVPFILPNGDIQNCIYSKIGNFVENDFWDIWNNEKSEGLRTILKEKKHLPACSRCCCMYDCHYIYAKNGIIYLKDNRKLVLEKEMTMLLPSSEGYFVLDMDRKQQGEEIPVIAMPFNNERQKKRIENCEKIIAKFSDMV